MLMHVVNNVLVTIILLLLTVQYLYVREIL